MKYDPKAILAPFLRSEAETDARVEAGIEANRKSPMLVSFAGPDDKPCGSVHVEVRQKSHAFKYGADLFMLDEIPGLCYARTDQHGVALEIIDTGMQRLLGPVSTDNR